MSRGLLVVVAILAAASCPAQTHAATADVPEGDEVRAIVDAATATFLKAMPQGVGISVGVWKDGKAYSLHYGTIEKGAQRPPTDATLYPIASITKTMTGALLARAELDGKLALDDDVRKYLDGEYPNLEFEGRPIRLFDLIDHRSGLPFFLPDVPESRPGFEGDVVPWPTRLGGLLDGYSREDFYADLHEVTLEAVPGERFAYSNAGAQLAGYILERIYGQSYESLLKEKLFGPLGMRDTTITVDARQEPSMAKGYDERGVLVPNNPDSLQGAGAVKSTVADMLKYVAWQVAEEDEAARRSHKPVVTEGNYSVGLNWQMLGTAENRLIWQSGNVPGFNSLCIVLPELKAGLVVFANEADRDSTQSLNVMANEILKGLDSRAIALP